MLLAMPRLQLKSTGSSSTSPAPSMTLARLCCLIRWSRASLRKCSFGFRRSTLVLLRLVELRGLLLRVLLLYKVFGMNTWLL